ncbi:hypothetical protein GE061_008904, partial [Apolygus lucorum]
MTADVTGSQHSLISFTIRERRTGPIRPAQKGRFCEKKANWERYEEALTERLRATQFPNIRTRRELEDAVNKITGILVESASESMPVQRLRKGSPPWWNMRLERLRKRVVALKRRVRRARDSVSEELNQQYRETRREYTKAVRLSKTINWRNFVTEEGRDQPWGTPYRVARKVGPRFQMAVLQGDPSLTWNEAASSLLQALFPDDSEVGEDDNMAEIRSAMRIPATIGTESAIPQLTDELVQELVNSFKPGKAPGIDRIEVRSLKKAWNLVYPWLITIFQKCFEIGAFPYQWKVGKLCVLKKSGDRDPADPKGYRPLCLLSVPGKLLEKVMVSRLSEVLTQASPAQHGFRKDGDVVGNSVSMDQNQVFQQSVTLTAKMWPQDNGTSSAGGGTSWPWRMPTEQLPLIIAIFTGGALIILLVIAAVLWRFCVAPHRNKDYRVKIENAPTPTRPVVPVLPSESAVYLDPKSGQWSVSSRVLEVLPSGSAYTGVSGSHWFYNNRLLDPAALDRCPVLPRSITVPTHHKGPEFRPPSAPQPTFLSITRQRDQPC